MAGCKGKLAVGACLFCVAPVFVVRLLCNPFVDQKDSGSADSV